ncbi:MAG: hypothetical protein AAGA64_14190 [Bacteroidota bacterium]
MKLYKNIFWSLFVALGLVFSSCDDEEDTIPFTEAANDISFPDHADFSASFTSIDDVILDVAVDGPASSLSVTGDGQSFGDVALTNGSGNFTRTLADLGYPWTDPANSLELSFAATSSRRLFDISISNPISMDFTVGSGDDAVDFNTSTSVNLDSSYFIYFEAAPENAIIDNYELFIKIGEESDYPDDPAINVNVNSNEIEEASAALVADSAIYDLSDTIYYRLVVNSGALAASTTGTVLVNEVELTETGTVTLLSPNYPVSSSQADSLNNAFNLSELKVMADSVLVDSPDSADIKLEVMSGNLTLMAGAGSNTEYVIAGSTFSFSGATYESVRDAFNSGMAVSSIDEIELLDTSTTILVRIGNIPNASYPSSDNKRYAAIQIANIVKEQNGVKSEITFDYKAPTQAD